MAGLPLSLIKQGAAHHQGWFHAWYLIFFAIAAAYLFWRTFLQKLYEDWRALKRRVGPRASAKQPEPSLIGVSIPDEPCPMYRLQDPHVGFIGEGRFCHLEVRSLSADITLRNCRARLIHVEHAQSQQWIEDTRFTAKVRMKWAHADPKEPHAQARDIEPDLPQLLDVVSTDPRFPGQALIVSLDQGPVGLPVSFGPGIYRATMRVSADNSAAVDYTFILSVVDSPVVGVMLGSAVT